MIGNSDETPNEGTVSDSAARVYSEALHEAVSFELRRISTSFESAAVAPAKRWGGYHQAAAVLSTFEIGKIKPVAEQESKDAIEDLLADSVRTYDDPVRASSRPKTDEAEETKESL